MEELKTYKYQNKQYIMDGNRMWIYNGKNFKEVEPYTPIVKPRETQSVRVVDIITNRQCDCGEQAGFKVFIGGREIYMCFECLSELGIEIIKGLK
jgi:hypothetical protein